MTFEEKKNTQLCVMIAIGYVMVIIALALYALKHPQLEEQKQYEQVKEEVIDDLIEYLEWEKEQDEKGNIR